CASDGDSDSESDYEQYVDEICREDVPRLGLVKLPTSFATEKLEWQFADEFWPSHHTEFSHETEFKGEDPEPLPVWFR
ncbi:hypothetical protein R1flu_008799, partial [Riccia fluitans]